MCRASMNTLKAAFVAEIRAVLAEVKANKELIGLVVVSGKKDSFIAGADISMLAACTSARMPRRCRGKGR